MRRAAVSSPVRPSYPRATVFHPQRVRLSRYSSVAGKGFEAYSQAYSHSITDPEGFWRGAAQNIAWVEPPSKILDSERKPFYRWFPDGTLNMAYNCVDRHVEAGRGNDTALVWDSPVTKTTRSFSFSDLQNEVSRLAGLLHARGVGKGDRVVLYMPMVPEALFAMLACARIGAIHSVVFGGFAPAELALRIEDAKPKAILTASCGIEVARLVPYKPLLDKALASTKHQPDFCLVLQRPMHYCDLVPGRDVEWYPAVLAASPVTSVPVEATHPLYILYTSGTTGKPKGVLRDTGGYAVALRWSMENIYGMQPGEVFWAGSDIGWVVGHSYAVYGPLLNGNTTVMYEGKPVNTPDAGAFWRVVSQHKVKAFFTAPTALRAIRGEDPSGHLIKQYDMSSLERMFVAGERCDVHTSRWAEHHLKVPVVDHWWQTETGWPISARCTKLDQRPPVEGSSNTPVPGWQVDILGSKSEESDEHDFTPAKDIRVLSPKETGSIAVKLPLPPGALMTLFNNDKDYVDKYLSAFEGYYVTGDAGFKDEEGNCFIMTRTDDIINVAAHRLSTSDFEEVICGHSDVAECAVIGIKDELKGQVPFAVIVLKSGASKASYAVIDEVIDLVREKIGPVASFRKAIVARRLPKTRSGKVLRKTMRQMADGEHWKVPATIDDAEVLSELTQVFEDYGFTVRKAST